MRGMSKQRLWALIVRDDRVCACVGVSWMSRLAQVKRWPWMDIMGVRYDPRRDDEPLYLGGFCGKNTVAFGDISGMFEVIAQHHDVQSRGSFVPWPCRHRGASKSLKCVSIAHHQRALSCFWSVLMFLRSPKSHLWVLFRHVPGVLEKIWDNFFVNSWQGCH